MKDKYCGFSGYKQRTKVCLVYLETKQQQNRYGSCVFKLKCQKTVERTYLKTSKQKRKYR